ncbi:hypothetical protein A3C57_00010 [Candidatus Nomurabacteria bacterium RIFCSPHIGHO2_02_FULL_33_12]|uniref:Uncharacterized protein n=1 Tax=Candidatus Nomurabacteria bacterium RIFCSPLOWO2_01_FULL_33_17 TaxID=1801764 RepID=A0A1F6WQS5_9BACT|nr:MAG: hypothetical protein A3C57_00010 [Candidatus Nomurabacteria bacterium RIFCSPHIGHO2_02_FULL_33_12]OGI84238.1 MAG: hypothetical protein A2903_02400 [Candidatus Nomurabacteria bacterium RIFCSPLOWO2_01_FULL_33_17]
MKITQSKTTTVGQIDKAVANYRALLDKHAKEFNTEAVQIVLGQPELATEQLAVFRKRVEAISNMIVRIVKVNRNQFPKEAINATGRVQYVNDSVLAEMPHGKGEEVKVYFFKISRQISCADLEKEYELRDLKPDPTAQTKVNEDDPAFADTYPNGSQWKDKNGKLCFSTFNRYDDERYVLVSRDDNDWYDHWWFAGVRK